MYSTKENKWELLREEFTNILFFCIYLGIPYLLCNLGSYGSCNKSYLLTAISSHIAEYQILLLSLLFLFGLPSQLFTLILLHFFIGFCCLLFSCDTIDQNLAIVFSIDIETCGWKFKNQLQSSVITSYSYICTLVFDDEINLVSIIVHQCSSPN